MKVNRIQLNRMTDIARKEMQYGVKHKHETHDEFLAKCWLNAIRDVMLKEGYDIGVEVERLTDTVIEPLE